MANNLTIRHFRAFVAIAQSGSFRVAADRLGISSPALSTCIRQMEDFLGLTLFDRTTRRVQLTAIGADFHPMVERLLKDFDAAVVDIQNTAVRKRGRVVVACLPSIGFRFMPTILSRFHGRHPEIAVQIQDDHTHDMMARVARSQVDFVISSQWHVDPESQFIPILDDKYVAVFPSRSPLAAKASIRWSEIVDYPFLAMAQGTHTRELMDAALAQKRITISPFYVASQMLTILGMVSSGMGIAALPANALPIKAPKGLTTRPLVDPVITRMIGFTIPRRRSLSPAAESFMETCKEVIVEANRTAPQRLQKLNSPNRQRRGSSKT